MLKVLFRSSCPAPGACSWVSQPGYHPACSFWCGASRFALVVGSLYAVPCALRREFFGCFKALGWLPQSDGASDRGVAALVDPAVIAAQQILSSKHLAMVVQDYAGDLLVTAPESCRGQSYLPCDDDATWFSAWGGFCLRDRCLLGCPGCLVAELELELGISRFRVFEGSFRASGCQETVARGESNRGSTACVMVLFTRPTARPWFEASTHPRGSKRGSEDERVGEEIGVSGAGVGRCAHYVQFCRVVSGRCA